MTLVEGIIADACEMLRQGQRPRVVEVSPDVLYRLVRELFKGGGVPGAMPRIGRPLRIYSPAGCLRIVVDSGVLSYMVRP